MADEGATQLLVGYVAGQGAGDLPAEVIHEARRCLMNFIGCSAGGFDHDVSKAVAGGLAALSGPPSSSMIGLGRKGDALLAALYNGTSASAHSFDDTHGEAMVHAGAPVCAAALATSQWLGAKGGNLLAAIATGVEVTCRLSKAVSVAPALGNIAWYQTGIAGGVGAAVACSRLLALDAVQTANAIGIAVSQSSGTRIMQGSMAMLMLAGHTAQCGIRAALVAQHGLQAPSASIEGKYGFAELYSERPYLKWLTDDLGHRHEILSNTYKSYPAGVVLHPVIDACRELKSRHREISPEAIAEVTVHIPQAAVVLTDRVEPETRTAGQVSAQHWTAVALVSDTLGLREGMLPALRDPVTTALRHKVKLVADPALGRDGAQVRVRLHSGQTYESSVFRGCAPMSDAQIEEKFARQAGAVMPEDKVRALAAAIWALRDTSDAGDLGALL